MAEALKAFTNQMDGIITPAVTMAMQETFKPDLPHPLGSTGNARPKPGLDFAASSPMIPTASSNLTSSVTTPMKYVALILAAALLWASHASAQIVQLNSLTDTTTGIAYRVKTREVSASTLLTSTDHTILANATSGAITLSLPRRRHEHRHAGVCGAKDRFEHQRGHH